MEKAISKEREISRKIEVSFDPRTKLMLLICIAAFVLGGLGGPKMTIFCFIFSCIPLILLIISNNLKASILYLLVYVTGNLAEYFLLPKTTGTLNFVLLAIIGIITRFLPSIMMGIFAMSTTKVSEFIASMEKMHISDKIIIPMSVMFRFFPTVREESKSINTAMKMRRIGLANGKFMGVLEYRVIPMITCSVKIGEELSAAALTRGLGAPIKRTNICKIGFHIQDVIIFLICILSIIYFAISSF